MKNSNIKSFYFSLLAITVSVLAITLVYAGFTQTLRVNGSAEVKAAKWYIHFDNLSAAQTEGQLNLVTPAEISTSKTHIGDYRVVFYNPGSSLTYTFDVVNEGNFNAEITSLTKTAPTCSGNSEVCNYLTYELKYTTSGEDYNIGDSVAVGDTLAAGESRGLILTLSLSSTMTADKLPDSDILIGGLGITIIYSQASGRKEYGVCSYNFTEYTGETTENVTECTPVAEEANGATYTTCTLSGWSEAEVSRVDTCDEVPKTADGLTATECVYDSDCVLDENNNVNSCTKSETANSKVTCTENKWSTSTSSTNDCTKSGSTSSNTYYVSCSEKSWGNPTSSTYPTSCQKSEGNTSKVTCESGYYKHVCGSTSTYNKSSTKCDCGSSCSTYSGYYRKLTYSRSAKYTKKTGTRVSKYNQKIYSKKYNKSEYTRLFNESVYTRDVTPVYCWR